MKTFAERIADMNAMYGLPVNFTLVVPADTDERLKKFKKTLLDEVDEVDDIIDLVVGAEAGMGPSALDVAVALADWLADLTVFVRSEAMRFGIPLEAVLDIVMDSNASKLGADGKPIYDENGKFLKGPNYWRPEPQIAELLQDYVVPVT